MREIQLTPYKYGRYTKVDDQDYEFLTQWEWGYDRGYAVRYEGERGHKTKIYMHRVILSSTSGNDTDHIDHDRLNNQRYNLRVCSHSNNVKNSIKHKTNKSGYKGVNWNKNARKWQARITVDWKQFHLGYFEEILDAAVAYDRAATHHYGEFANLNFPELQQGA